MPVELWERGDRGDEFETGEVPSAGWREVYEWCSVSATSH